MSDNHTRYYAIHQALKQQYPTPLTGHRAAHLATLAKLVSGIVGSRKCHLPAIAGKMPAASKPQSRVRSFERWLDNEGITVQIYYLPYVRALLRGLPAGPLVLVMDGSELGRACVRLAVNVIYQKRALPLCWLVINAKKGHLSEETHLKLLKQAQKVVADATPERHVVFLGDGEFDGCELQATLQAFGWTYVLRTAQNIQLCDTTEGITTQTVRPDSDWFSLKALCLRPGDRIELTDVLFTKQAYGPVLVVAVWERGQKEPLILVSNCEFLQEACLWYKRRFGIETFFSDTKSRGFYIGHSHIRDTKHMNRLLIAVSLAYLWIVCLGVRVVMNGWLPHIHRTNRCDWSLFQIGLNWLDHCLNEGLPLWVDFRIPSGRRTAEGVEQ